MDALITTILAGAVVALIGAFAAYYFGGRRERQKQVYEERSDLRERRIEVLSEIQVRAYSVTESLGRLAERVAELRGKIPNHANTTYQSWEKFFSEYEELAQQRDAVLSDIESLRGSANRLWLAARTPLPTVVNPAPSDEPTHDDDYLGEGHPEVYDSPHSLGAPHKLLMSIVPGVSAFHHPTFRCLKRSRLALL